MVKEIMEISKMAGLDFNSKETEIVGTGEPKSIEVGEEQIEEIEEIIYLGQVVYLM